MNRLIALLLGATIAYAAKKASARGTELQAGRRYRYVVDVVPPLADIGSLESSLSALGLTDVALDVDASNDQRSRIEFTSLPESATRTVKAGDVVVSVAGHSLILVSATEAP